jgi:hypothetical protein
MVIQVAAAPVMGAVKVGMQMTMQVMRAAGQGAASAVRSAATMGTRAVSTGARSAAHATRSVARVPSPNGIAMQARSLPRVEPSRISAQQIRSIAKGPAKAMGQRDSGIVDGAMKIFLDTQKGEQSRGR